MEINDIYITNDIIDLLLNQLNLKNKINFIKSNKFIYHNFIKLYEKYKIYLFINNDYLIFYNYLKNNDYSINDLNDFIKISIRNIPIVYKNNICGFYDLKYIFELFYINQNNLLSDSEIKNINLHFYIHFYEKIKNILNNDRNICIQNIEKTKYLISLHQNFYGFYKSNELLRSRGLPKYKKSNKKFHNLILN